MKRIVLMVAFCLCTVASFAMLSTTEVRNSARFMTDRMAYELRLSSMQITDVYEINFDFFDRVRYVADDLAAGYSYAIDEYYKNLDLRNDDLSYVLTRSQFERFMNRDYFYRPLYVNDRSCRLRIYAVYDDPTFFYFAAPLNFLTYVGIHSRAHFAHGYYCNRYHHPRYTGIWARPTRHSHYDYYRRHDFGPGIAGRPPRPIVDHRPGIGHRPDRPSIRPPHENRPTRPGYNDRPGRRPSQVERPSRPGHNDRPNIRPSREERPSRPNNNDRPNIRPSRDERPSRPVSIERPSRPDRNDRPAVRPSRIERPQSPDKNERPSRVERPQRPNVMPSRNERPSRPERPAVHPSRNERPAVRPTNRPRPSERPGRDRQAAERNTFRV